MHEQNIKGKPICIAILFILAFISCSSDDCNIQLKIQLVKDKANFDYNEYTISLLDELSRNDLLIIGNQESYASYFKEKNYCEFNYVEFMKNHETFFSTSPSIGSCVLSLLCDTEEARNDIIFSTELNLTIAEKIKLKDKAFFSSPESKYLLAYYTALLIGDCKSFKENISKQFRHSKWIE